MMSSRPNEAVSRRTAMAGIATTGLGLALAARGRTVSAHEASPEAMASHPAVGSWNCMTPGGPAIGICLPDGTNLIVVPATAAGPNGVEFVSLQAGRWEPVSDRGIHFTSTQYHSDANGKYIGSVTVDGYPVISDDGKSLLDDQSQAVVTIRDANGAVVQQIPGAGSPPVTGTKMEVGAPNFTVATPVAGTPSP